MRILQPKLDINKIESIDYNLEKEFDGENLTFFPSGHVIGSAQVLVKSNGLKILYSGDFRLQSLLFGETPIPKADVLVMEATYGNPTHVRNFDKDVPDLLCELIKSKLPHAPVYIFGYYGKLQEILWLINTKKIRAPVIMPEKIYKLMKISEKLGLTLGVYYSTKSEDGKKFLQTTRFIGLYHTGHARYIKDNGIKIFLSGWEFSSPIRKVNSNEYIVAYSDHADFEDLLSYVSKVDPKLVITDNYRVGDAQSLATAIKARLGIEAYPMP